LKIRLNLATSPLETNRRFSVASVTVGVLGVAAMLFLAWHAYSVRRSDAAFRAEQTRLLADMDRMRAQRQELDAFFSQPETVQRRNLAIFLNSLIAQRAFPWTKIFMDLERSLPVGVRVVSIEPRLVGDHVELRLTIGALTDDGKLQFLHALENSSEFSQVEVLSETRSARATDSDHILLSLLAHYSVA
jgi:Tfp pilus assembly protein PilN